MNSLFKALLNLFHFAGVTAGQDEFHLAKRSHLGWDELIGAWSNEDGSGIHMLAGQQIVFMKDKTGTMASWGSHPNENDEEISYLCESTFEWMRVDKQTIRMREMGLQIVTEVNEEGEESIREVPVTSQEWKDISYTLNPFIGYTKGWELKQINSPQQFWYWRLYRF